MTEQQTLYLVAYWFYCYVVKYIGKVKQYNDVLNNLDALLVVNDFLDDGDEDDNEEE